MSWALITNAAPFFITKWGKIYYKTAYVLLQNEPFLLQNMAGNEPFLLQNAAGITKRAEYYKTRHNIISV